MCRTVLSLLIYFFKYLEISLFRNHFNLAIKVFKNLNDLTSNIHRKEKKRKVKPAAFVGGILVGTPTEIIKELAYMATSGGHFSRPLGMGSFWS